MNERLSFLIAGAQKCGTTALDAYLRTHPQLQMSTPKELHVFDDEQGIDWRTPDLARLHAGFDGEAQGRTRGESTPVTLYWSPAHPRILHYNRDMRFIVMVRDPVERAWSHWRMNIARGLDDLAFPDAVRWGRLRTLDDPRTNGWSRHTSYVERGYYARQLAALSGLFPWSNILVLEQAALLADPDAVLAKVSAFLGVAPFAPVEPIRLNEGPESDGTAMSDDDRAHLQALFQPDLIRLKDMTGVDLTTWRSQP